ncbi:hypothetical protein [Streptomyces kanasensis]|uniref:hypothetical protein n=1 Tax=Streptomyces kanasensis TaxID=936756 RepID=UPI0038230F5F
MRSCSSTDDFPPSTVMVLAAAIIATAPSAVCGYPTWLPRCPRGSAAHRSGSSQSLGAV